MLMQIVLAAVIALSDDVPTSERNTPETPAPTVLALELGTLGEENAPPPSRLEGRGTSERTFGPVRPQSRYGTYTGRNVGAYRGRGTGSYTGGGLGRIETFGMDQPPKREVR
jgi:hypothetical protein